MIKTRSRIIRAKLYNQQIGGELTRKDAKVAIHQEVMEHAKAGNEELRKLGLRGDIRTTVNTRRATNSHRISIKTDYDFNKLFRVGLGELMMENKLSKNALCVIGTLSSSVTFPTNAINLHSSYPAFEDLRAPIGMIPAPLKKALAELEDFEIIKRTREGGQYALYFNPFLICAGKLVEKDTYLLFKDSSYNPANV